MDADVVVTEGVVEALVVVAAGMKRRNGAQAFTQGVEVTLTGFA